MPSIDRLLAELDERVIARRVGIPHDEARMAYRLSSNTVTDFDEFTRVIAAYYRHQYAACVARGGALSRADAAGEAKAILEQEYRRRNGTIVSAFNDAHDGTNGGMRALLDIIAEALKAQAVERYARDAFDRNVNPNAWDEKVAIIRQFLDRWGTSLPASVRTSPPERYAQDHQDLIREFVRGLQRTSSIFRRL